MEHCIGFCGKPEGMASVERSRCRWDNSKRILSVIGCCELSLFYSRCGYVAGFYVHSI